MKTYEVGSARNRTLAALAAGPLVLAGCGGLNWSGESVSNVPYDPKRFAVDTAVEVADGHIADGAYIRNDPYRQEPEANSIETADNSCAQPEDPVPFKAFRSHRAEQDYDTPNGPFLRFNISQMPADIQKSCKEDVDGHLWVAEYLVRAENQTEVLVTTVR